MTRLRTAIQATRLAPVLVAVDDGDALVALRFLDPDPTLAEAAVVLARFQARGFEIVEHPRACAKAASQVRQFVAGKIRQLDVRVVTQGTEFQRAVWKAVARVPYGRTITYRDLATRIGRPNAWRAVARANATNPVALVVPCHRVIGSDGRAVGYNGGVGVKEALLALEARNR